MKRVSEYYDLRQTQGSLDFVDVDVEGDTNLFVDPQALLAASTDWSDHAVSLVQSFFGEVLNAINGGDTTRAQVLLRYLSEPNETHLGMSSGAARGRGLGQDSAGDVYEALSRSRAGSTGLLADLEDAALIIPGIDKDITSDMATNIIRGPLIAYTQETCAYYGIPVEQQDSGPCWNSTAKQWESGYVDLPRTGDDKLLLVPKTIVRQRMHYRADEYFNHYILRFLQEQELSAGGGLVELLKSGRRRVTKKSLKQRYGTGKETAARITQQYPQILDQYRMAKAGEPNDALTHEDLANLAGFTEPDFDALLATVIAVPTGQTAATDYEKAVEALLAALFYPALTDPVRQFNIHQDRKRIDIRYKNAARTGFFHWLAVHYPAPHIFVECKNYSRPIGNPEFDQLSGRFSPQRGRVGLLVYRSFVSADDAWQRCIDTAKDDRGWMIPLSDDDLKELVDERKSAGVTGDFAILQERFERLTN